MAAVLMLTTVITAATPVMTNPTIEAMVAGGIPLPVIVRAIRSATKIELYESKQDYNRLIRAGASVSDADQIMKAIHYREYEGIDRLPDGPVNPVAVVAKQAPVPAASVAPAPAVSEQRSPSIAPQPEEETANARAVPPPPLPTPAPIPKPVEPPVSPVPSAPGSVLGKKIFVDTNNGFDIFIMAAFRTKHVPVTIVNSRDTADYILDSSLFHSGGFVATTKFATTTRLSEAAFSLTSKSGEVVWAYAATKGSLLGRGGKQSVAEACAKHMLRDLFH